MGSFGGPEETRTPHLCNANAALYQMSYGPMNGFMVEIGWNVDALYGACREAAKP